LRMVAHIETILKAAICDEKEAVYKQERLARWPAVLVG